jgi:hypothetical protein
LVPEIRIIKQPVQFCQRLLTIKKSTNIPVSPLRITYRNGSVSLAIMAAPALIASIKLQLITLGVNAGSRWWFPKAGKSESMAAYLGGRSNGCSNRITVGF